MISVDFNNPYQFKSTKHQNKAKCVSIFIALTSYNINAGEPVTGDVVVQVLEQFAAQALYIKFNGKEKVHFVEVETKPKTVTNADGTTSYSLETIRHNRKCKRTMFQNKQELFRVDGGTFLQGEYRFPFMFGTSIQFPGSFSIEVPEADPKNLKKAIIEYGIGAKFESADDNVKSAKYKCEVIVKQNLPPLLLKEKPTEASFEITKCFCCGKGVGKMCANIEKNNYSLQEPITAKLAVINTQSKANITSLQMQLIQTITLSTKDGKKANFQETISTDNKQIFIAVGESMTDPISLEITNMMNPYKYSCKNYSQDFMLHPTTIGIYVQCDYKIKLIPIYSGCCVSGAPIIFPINLYAKELTVPTFAMPQSIDAKPQISYAEAPVLSNEMVVMQ